MKPLTILFAAALALSAQNARFDHKVRDLFFAGFAGDKEALAKAMTLSEATLKENPNHAEALVWNGSGIFFQSSEKFRNGDMAGGMALFQKGTGMMDRGVALAPKSIGVRIPRGSAYFAASRNMPPEVARTLIEKGVSDFEMSWDLQKDSDLSQFSQHSIGELWFGIADGNARLGNKDRATDFFTKLKDKLPGTPWAAKAERWLTNGKLAANDGNCVGCHMGSPKAFKN